MADQEPLLSEVRLPTADARQITQLTQQLAAERRGQDQAGAAAHRHPQRRGLPGRRLMSFFGALERRRSRGPPGRCDLTDKAAWELEEEARASSQSDRGVAFPIRDLAMQRHTRGQEIAGLMIELRSEGRLY